MEASLHAKGHKTYAKGHIKHIKLILLVKSSKKIAHVLDRSF